jgi:hypothetical protein
MLSLAQDADQAGFESTARRLLKLATAILDSPPPPKSFSVQ